MKDVTSTSFGIIIGVLLPGLAALWAIAPWFPAIANAFAKVQDAKTDVGLSVLGLMAALIAGLIVMLLRWLIFECWLCRKSRLGDEDFDNLASKAGTLAAFTAANDEHYRYHQFFGGIAVVLPFAYFSWSTPTCEVITSHRFWAFGSSPSGSSC
jgi:hypothetical protein